MATCAVPSVVNSAAGIVALSCAACTRLGVIFALPPSGLVHETTEPETIFRPAMVMAVAGLCAATLSGVIDVIEGVDWARADTVNNTGAKTSLRAII
jgi:hypothetical protein